MASWIHHNLPVFPMFFLPLFIHFIRYNHRCLMMSPMPRIWNGPSESLHPMASKTPALFWWTLRPPRRYAWFMDNASYKWSFFFCKAPPWIGKPQMVEGCGRMWKDVEGWIETDTMSVSVLLGGLFPADLALPWSSGGVQFGVSNLETPKWS